MNVRVRLIRHATLILEYNGHTLVVDPMLDDPGTRTAIIGTGLRRAYFRKTHLYLARSKMNQSSSAKGLRMCSL
jgi:L-ascorbate metabolism protein UlaG (beta-lactamase superfamily)